MTNRSRAELYLFILTIIWGSTFILTKFILERASPFVYIALRFAIASVLFSAIFYKRVQTISKDAIIKGAILGLLLFAGLSLQTIGLKFTTASKCAFITGLSVVFTPCFQLLIERRPPKKGNVIGVVLVSAGLYLMTSPQGSEFNIGDALTLVGAIAFGLFTVYLDIFSKEHDPAHLSFMQFVSAAMLASLAIPLLETAHLLISSAFLMNLGYLAVMPTVVALYIMTKHQRYTTPTRSAIIYSMEPPIAAVFALYLVGEKIGIGGLAGAVLIISGLVTSELSDVLFRRQRIEADTEQIE